MSSVICFGEMLWDLLPDGKKPGGAPINCATHLNRLGVPTAMISRVGQDPLGEELIAFFRARGVQMECVQIDPMRPTGVVVVDVTNPEEVAYEITKDVAWDHIHPEPAALKATTEKTLVYGTLAARSTLSRSTLEALLATCGQAVCDVNFRAPHYSKETVMPLLNAATTLKVNEEELREIASWLSVRGTIRECIQAVYDHYELEEILVSLGAKGALLRHQNGWFSQAAIPIKVADTIGSGDAFLAAYLFGRERQMPPENRLELAVAAGAYVATQKGATPPISLSILNQFLTGQASQEQVQD